MIEVSAISHTHEDAGCAVYAADICYFVHNRLPLRVIVRLIAAIYENSEYRRAADCEGEDLKSVRR